QASSSFDPTFYPMHPTVDRLWAYTVLTGQMKDFSWPDSDVTITNPDGSLSFESVSIDGDDCNGHRGSDVFPFGLLRNTSDGFEGAGRGNNFTNRELLARLDPRINALSYVYDNFKWTHCSEDG
ncbi:unnamed protein product, partial [Hapterophycus canaliculatus]